MTRVLPLAAALVLGVWPAESQTAWEPVATPDAELQFRLIQEPKQIEQILGDDLGGEFLLVEVEARPLFNTVLEFEREQFLMRCRYDNETSKAQSPARIAGGAVLSLDRRSGSGGVFAQDQDPLIVGGGPGTTGRPRRVGGDGGAFGNAGVARGETEVRQKRTEAEPLLERLERSELPLREALDPINGYLYFQMNPKRKLKHYELSYDGKFGEFTIGFEK